MMDEACPTPVKPGESSKGDGIGEDPEPAAKRVRFISPINLFPDPREAAIKEAKFILKEISSLNESMKSLVERQKYYLSRYNDLQLIIDTKK